MNGYHSVLLWCEFQVGCIALVGLGLSFLIARRSPRLAGSIFKTTLLIAVVLTLLAPFPSHLLVPNRFASWFDIAALSPKTDSVDLIRKEGEEETRPVRTYVPMVDLTRLLSSLRFTQSEINRLGRNHNFATEIACAILILIVVVGLLRFVTGIRFIRRIRRRSIPVTDATLQDHLGVLTKSIGCRSIPKICECPEFTDAAVIGWRHQVVILPSIWRTWTDDEVRAVLAHEVAHIARRDVAWRTLAELLLSVHYFNPLLHWLASRLTFCQELATDEIAALAVGHGKYLRSLSTLALRQDEFLGRTVAPNMLPVFSGQLIRRIKMLNSWKNSSSSRGRICQLATTSLLLMLGVALVVTRGMADPPSTEPKQTPIPIRTVSFTRSVADDKPQLDPTRDMFQQVPLDLSLVGADSPEGMFSVRLHDLLSVAEIRAFLPMINVSYSQGLGEALKADSQPSISFESIEWIAACPNLKFQKISSKEVPVAEQKTALMFGANSFAVRLAQPLDLKGWFDTYAPNTPRHSIEGRTVYQLQIPAVGPASMFIWMQDDRTLRMNSPGIEKITSETTLSDLSGKPSPADPSKESSLIKSTPVEWGPTWQRIDHGLVSVVLDQADLSGLLFDFENRKGFQKETLDAVENALLALKSRCLLTACSLDIASTPSRLGLRVSLVHATHDESLKSAEDLRVLLKQSQAFLLEIDEPVGESVEEAMRKKAIDFITDAIETSAISVEDYDDQTSSVVLSSSLPFSRMLELVIPPSSTD